VLDGEMLSTEGALLPPRSCVFVSADETDHRVASSPTTPRDVLVVQFPKSSTIDPGQPAL
jgi:hypothetical protein